MVQRDEIQCTIIEQVGPFFNFSQDCDMDAMTPNIGKLVGWKNDDIILLRTPMTSAS